MSFSHHTYLWYIYIFNMAEDFIIRIIIRDTGGEEVVCSYLEEVEHTMGSLHEASSVPKMGIGILELYI